MQSVFIAGADNVVQYFALRGFIQAYPLMQDTSDAVFLKSDIRRALDAQTIPAARDVVPYYCIALAENAYVNAI
jgi:hypothetical protein